MINSIKKTSAPKYLDIRDELEQEILTGKYGEAGALPHERDLAFRFGTTRLTLRKAMDDLEDRRLIRRIRGKGTFVIHKMERVRTAYVGVSFFSAPNSSPSLDAIVDVLDRYNRFAVVVRYGVADLAKEYDSVRQLVDENVGGLILSPTASVSGPHRDNMELFADVLQQEVPIVLIGRIMPEYKVSTVAFDHPKCETMAVEWLSRQGVRHVGFLGANFSYIVRSKFEAMDLACRKHKFDWDPKRDARLSGYSPDWVTEFPSEAILSLVKANPKIEALVCHSNKVAAIALSALRQSGIKHNIKFVVGNDGLHMHEKPDATLMEGVEWITSIIDMGEIGNIAAALLMKHLTKGIPDKPIVMKIKPKFMDMKSFLELE